MNAYQSGAKTYKDMLNNAGLTAEKVDAVIDDLQEMKDTKDLLDDALSNTSFSEGDIER